MSRPVRYAEHHGDEAVDRTFTEPPHRRVVSSTSNRPVDGWGSCSGETAAVTLRRSIGS